MKDDSTRKKDAPAVRCPVAEWAEWDATLPALILPDEVLSYGELDFAIRLQRKQLEEYAGQAIGLQEWNSPELISTLFGAWRLGCLTLLLNPRLPRSQADHIVASVDADMVSSGKNRDAVSYSEPSFKREKDVLRPVEFTRYDPQALATGMLTSGTTGRPRLIIHSIENHLASARSSGQVLGLGPGADWLWSLSSFHVGGLAILWRCFIAGAAVRFMPRDLTLIEHLQAAPPTILSLVPTQLGDLVAARIPCPARLEDVIVGGAPISSALMSAALDLGYPVRTTYGLTETSSMVTLSQRWKQKGAIHAGKPLPGVRIEVTETGAISVTSSSVSVGEYLDGTFVPRKGQTILTQDKGALTAAGELEVHARLDDVIISGGENVSLSAIEEALLRLPEIMACRVVAIPHPRYGQRPVAFVQLKNQTADATGVTTEDDTGEYVVPENDILQALAAVLPSHALPEKILLLPKLPAGASKLTWDQLVGIATRSE